MSRVTRVVYGDGTLIMYSYDAAGNRLTKVAKSNIQPPDTLSPVVRITNPTTGRVFIVTSNTVALSGTASDESGIMAVTVTNQYGFTFGGSGTTSWSSDSIPLSNAKTRFTVTAADPTGNIGRDHLTVVVMTQQLDQASLMALDSDGDGIEDWKEILSGTDETNRWSYLAVEHDGPQNPMASGFVIPWYGSTGVAYTVYRSMDPLGGVPALQGIESNIPGIGGLMRYTDTNMAPVGVRFYTIGVDLP